MVQCCDSSCCQENKHFPSFQSLHSVRLVFHNSLELATGFPSHKSHKSLVTTERAMDTCEMAGVLIRYSHDRRQPHIYVVWKVLRSGASRYVALLLSAICGPGVPNYGRKHFWNRPKVFSQTPGCAWPLWDSFPDAKPLPLRRIDMVCLQGCTELPAQHKLNVKICQNAFWEILKRMPHVALRLSVQAMLKCLHEWVDTSGVWYICKARSIRVTLACY